MSRIALSQPATFPTGDYFNAKQIGGLAFVDDKEDLQHQVFTLDGLQHDYLVKQRRE